MFSTTITHFELDSTLFFIHRGAGPLVIGSSMRTALLRSLTKANWDILECTYLNEPFKRQKPRNYNYHQTREIIILKYNEYESVNREVKHDSTS